MALSRPNYDVTMSDVAALARVSRATVSRVLAGQDVVSGSTKVRVLNAVRSLGYVPNANAQSLAQPRRNVAGVLLRDPRNPVYGHLHASLQECAADVGLEVVAATVGRGGGVDAEREGVQRLLEQRVSGILLASGSMPSSLVAEISQIVPTVAVGRMESDPQLVAVSYDERANCALVADAVREAGHRRAAVVQIPTQFSFMESLRGELLVGGLRERGIEALAVNDDDALVDLARSGTITCLCFPTDLRMLAFLDRAAAAGISVPGDISVTGMDGIMQGRDFLGLTTVRLPVEEVAQRSLEVMADMLGRTDADPLPRSEAIPGRLVRGRTLRDIRGESA
jgi:LacI family transcriptional regulator